MSLHVRVSVFSEAFQPLLNLAASRARGRISFAPIKYETALQPKADSDLGPVAQPDVAHRAATGSMPIVLGRITCDEDSS